MRSIAAVTLGLAMICGGDVTAHDVQVTTNKVIITVIEPCPPQVTVVPVRPVPVVIRPAVTVPTLVPVMTWSRVGVFGWRRAWRPQWAVGPPVTVY